MATYYISHVRLEPGPGLFAHEHIEQVKLTDGQVVTRAVVIQAIYAGNQFYTYANPPAAVYVHPCPYCRAHDYITTHPDNTKINNLLNLQKF